MDTEDGATIKKIIIYDDNVIELVAECNNCKSLNTHTIGHASIKNKDSIEIDFSKLGSRCCNNQTKETMKRPWIRTCYADYKLYHQIYLSIFESVNMIFR